MPILLIEDNAADAELALTALRDSGLSNELCHFSTCEEARDWLNLHQEKTPLILLDLIFPGHMDGFEFLKWLRTHPEFRSIPVIIVSVDRYSKPDAYGLGAIGYLVKPINRNVLLDAIQNIGLRWQITA